MIDDSQIKRQIIDEKNYTIDKGNQIQTPVSQAEYKKMLEKTFSQADKKKTDPSIGDPDFIKHLCQKELKFIDNKRL